MNAEEKSDQEKNDSENHIKNQNTVGNSNM